MTHPNRAAELAAGLLPTTLVDGEAVRRPLAERMAHHNVPGISVAVIEDDEIAWAEGFGTQEAGKDDPVKADTLFAGASISKPVTALLALQLVEQGRLDLDRNVNDQLKSWKLPENEFTHEQPVTLRHLLSHRAGTTVHGFGGITARPTILDTLEGRPPAKNAPVRVNKVPGGVRRYSGGGTTIAQLMIEEASGTPYAALAEERVFKPLGMTRSSFVQPLPPEMLALTSRGHNEDGSVIAGGYSWCPQLGAGGVYTTAPDYARFMIACRTAWLGKPNPLLGQALAREMMTPVAIDGQGLGWRIMGAAPNQRFAHGGSCQGYQCQATGFLERGQGIVVLTNAVGGLNFYWEVMSTIADMYGWQGYAPPPKRVVPLSPAEMERFVGTYAIVSGVDAPHLKMWIDDGKLYSELAGMRGGAREVRMGADGRGFNGTTPSESIYEYGPDGRVASISVVESGVTEIIRAERALSP